MKPTWLAAAVLIAGWLIIRRHKQERLTQAFEVLVVAVALVVGFGLVHLPNVEKLLEDVGKALGPWTYPVVGLLAYLETGAFIGFVAPGETAVIVAGLVAGQGEISVLGLIATVWICAVCGDLTSYYLGRRLGRAWLLKHGGRLKITEERLDQVEGFFERRGGMTLLVGRFLGFVRPLAPFIAGASRMPVQRFAAYDILAAGLWAATFSILGYVFWRSIDQLTAYVSRGLFAFGTFVVVVAALVLLVRLRRDRGLRDRARTFLHERENEPGWKLVARVAGPAWRLAGRPAAAVVDTVARFGQERLTPGNRGLELTTLVMLTVVGGFAFVLLGDRVTLPGEPRIDRVALRFTRDAQTPALVDAARVLTSLGTIWAIGAAGLLVTAWTVVRRRWVDAVAVVVGIVVSVVVVHRSKDVYDRLRPPGALADTLGSAFPSGHSLQAVTWIALATVLVRAGAGWAVRFAAVGVAVGIAVVVAATRVYLRAHWLTDVLGGIALGLVVWGVVGCVAVLVGSVRHNEEEMAPTIEA